MTEAAKNEIIILPEYDEDGRAFYTLPNARTEDNLVVICPKVAEKVIPVIFLPGVMGSNLKRAGLDKKVWHADLPGGIDALPWIFKGPDSRKKLLDPANTDVDLTGTVFYNDMEGKLFPSRKSRGWGSALYKSYGEPLHTLQVILNDSHILLENRVKGTDRQTARQLLIGEDLGAEKGEEALTEEEVRQSYEFLFPLHVFGYNWLQSNEDSAKHLKRYIRDVLLTYHGRLAVNKVILVTHSMGGLVARHYSEKMNGRENILGIVHGVMPDLGSPAAYRRMKTGERGIVGAVIGDDAANMMPVLAQSPGPLQLLPGIAYGMGWLKIHSKEGVESKPVSDPYTEIYLNESDWWRLCEKALLLDNVESEWKAYQNRIKKDVRKFIEELNGKYHPTTYAFYGASKKHPSDDHLIWRQIPELQPRFVTPTELLIYRRVHPNKFELFSSGSPGDGTVPVRAGRISYSGIRSLLATAVDHEGAYAAHTPDNRLSVAMKFTLRAIIKMVREVPPCG
ncbi:esterase/lipase family protein [Enterobacteriaceae bacterium LUAb1]